MDPLVPGWLLDLAHRDGIAAIVVALISAALAVYKIRRARPRRTPTPPPPSIPARRQRLLLVDDDAVAAATLQRVLEAEFPALEVITTGFAVEAAEILHGPAPPDVAILDCYLPDGNGWELARSAPRTTRVILISGAVDGRLLPQLAEGAEAAALRKPFELDDLITVVRSQLAATARRSTATFNKAS